MIKKKLMILLVSMLVFTGLFIYGAIQYIEIPETRKENISDIKNDSYVYENAWIEKAENNEITFFCENETYKMETEKSLGQTIEHTIGDVSIKNGLVVSLSLKPDKVAGKVIAVEDKEIVLEVEGKTIGYPLAENFTVYSNLGKIKEANKNNLLVGYSNADFIFCNQEICAAVITKPVAVENIRVLLRTQGFKDLLHDNVVITCNKDYTVRTAKETKSFKAGKKISIKNKSKLVKDGRAVFSSKEKGAKFTITSFKRNEGCPSYSGNIEVSREEGKLALINELPLEEYLYSVIPSEMPTSYGIEALKVQAVCARTYAYKQLLQNSYSQYGAHIDDSVASQVYNNIPSDKNSIEAVNETKGEVLQYDNEIINAYYFSTSWGYTANAADVWIGEGEKEYLAGGSQLCKGVKADFKEDFKEEENFLKFLKNKKAKTYDSSFPWYRWSVKIDAKDIQTALENNIKARYEVNPALIKTKDENGTYESVSLDSVGEIVDITIGNRCRSGLVNEIIVEGTKKTVKIYSEYNIRLLLAPISSTIKRHDKSTVDGLSMLPSAFFTIKKTKDGCFVVEGGGYGHGVGMSQNGAKSMVEAGLKYNAILEHYYKGVSLTNLYLSTDQ